MTNEKLQLLYTLARERENELRSRDITDPIDKKNAVSDARYFADMIERELSAK